MKKLIPQNNRIVLNLAGVSYIDSGGLGTLVALYTTARSAGGTIKLASLTKRVGDLLQVTKLLTVFEVFESEAGASIRSARPRNIRMARCDLARVWSQKSAPTPVRSDSLKESDAPKIMATIRKIPRGRVSTYGAVAWAAGYPGGARGWRRFCADLAIYLGTACWAQAGKSN